MQTAAADSLWQKVRVEQSSRKRRTKRVWQHRVADVSCRRQEKAEEEAIKIMQDGSSDTDARSPIEDAFSVDRMF